jgi:hypothetical protein
LVKNIINCIKVTKAGIVTSKLLFYPRFVKVPINSENRIEIKKEIIINGDKTLISRKFCRNIVETKDSIMCDKNSTVYLPVFPSQEDWTDVNATLNIAGLDKNIKAKTVDMIQNAGSAINKNYDGYDIGFWEEDGGQYEDLIERESACGAAMCMSKKDFIEVGGFDDNFFMYYEDSDLSLRLKRKLGKKIVYCPKAVVRHVHAASSVEWSLFFCYYVFRNKQLFLLKNYSFRVFVYSYIKFIVSTGKELLSKSRTKEFKINQLKSVFSVFISIPRYILSKK